MRQVTEERRALGDECWCIWGRGRPAEHDHEYNFGNKPEFYLDVLQTRLDGKAGFHSKMATRRLLKKLDEIKPDVVHLHNLHGYYVNVEMLFDWLAKHGNVQVKWTLHDCWAFTGHCAHFVYAKCDQWQTFCSTAGVCPQLATYPKTISKSSCAWNYEHKRACFTQLPSGRMTIVTVSYWLERLVKQSFLAKYPTEVRYNTIDTSTFRPTPSDFRERYGVGNRFMVLGVASSWTNGKGLRDFTHLAADLDPDDFVVVLIGLTPKQIRSMPEQMISLERTKTKFELAEAYTAANVFVQPSEEETFSLVVAEAEACGTRTIVMANSACVEASTRDDSIVASDYEGILAAILSMSLQGHRSRRS